MEADKGDGMRELLKALRATDQKIERLEVSPFYGNKDVVWCGLTVTSSLSHIGYIGDFCTP